MGAVSPARGAALAYVSERRRRSARMRDLLRANAAMSGLAEEDRRLATRLALGETAAEALLYELVCPLVKRPSQLEPRVRDAMLLSAFEILYLDTPHAVAVNEGVELVRKISPRATGMANAVLRRVASEIAPDVEHARLVCAAARDAVAGSVTARDIALAGGLPLAFAKQLVVSCGCLRAAQISLLQQNVAPIWVTALPFELSADEVFSELSAEGLEPQAEAMSGCYRLEHPSSLADSPLISQVHIVIADYAAQLVALLAAPCPGQTMLEIGQGRATKTLLMQAATWRMGGLAEMVCVDSVESKVRLAEQRLKTAGIAQHTRCLACDATALEGADELNEPAEGFDVVFVDAPCSGTGTMRRHPEIPGRLAQNTREHIDELAGLQLQLLSQAASHVRVGGALIYSTCSVLHEECEALVEEFLASESGSHFEVEPVNAAPAAGFAGGLIEANMTSEGFLRTWPIPDGWDGHFCARLARSTE